MAQSFFSVIFPPPKYTLFVMSGGAVHHSRAGFGSVCVRAIITICHQEAKNNMALLLLWKSILPWFFTSIHKSPVYYTGSKREKPSITLFRAICSSTTISPFLFISQWLQIIQKWVILCLCERSELRLFKSSLVPNGFYLDTPRDRF